MSERLDKIIPIEGGYNIREKKIVKDQGGHRKDLEDFRSLRQSLTKRLDELKEIGDVNETNFLFERIKQQIEQVDEFISEKELLIKQKEEELTRLDDDHLERIIRLKNQEEQIRGERLEGEKEEKQG